METQFVCRSPGAGAGPTTSPLVGQGAVLPHAPPVQLATSFAPSTSMGYGLGMDLGVPLPDVHAFSGPTSWRPPDAVLPLAVNTPDLQLSLNPGLLVLPVAGTAAFGAAPSPVGADSAANANREAIAKAPADEAVDKAEGKCFHRGCLPFLPLPMPMPLPLFMSVANALLGC